MGNIEGMALEIGGSWADRDAIGELGLLAGLAPAVRCGLSIRLIPCSQYLHPTLYSPLRKESSAQKLKLLY